MEITQVIFVLVENIKGTNKHLFFFKCTLELQVFSIDSWILI